MSHKNHDMCKMHDRGKATIKETSRKNFLNEQKEMQHELSQNKENLSKLLNDHFCYKTTSRNRGQYIVKFQHPDTHRMEKLCFDYENNLKALEHIWLNPEV